MKCEECLRLLDLHLDEELPPRDAEAVAAHLGGCEPCARRHQNLRDEQSLYLRYGCDSTESPSFWDEVLSRVEADKVSAPDTLPSRLRRRLAGARPTLAAPRFSPLATAAMLLTAVGLTALIMIYVRPRDDGPSAAATSGYNGAGAAASQSGAGNDAARAASSGAPAGDVTDGRPGPLTAEESHGRHGRGWRGTKPSIRRAAKGGERTPTAETPEPAPERLIQEAERKYLSAIAALSRDVGRRRPQMDSETITRFERTLAVVDKAIAETRAAARRHPSDPVVVQYMMAAYAKKVDLLRGMAQD
jgi:anti-sigma factor RsiW